MGGDGRRGPFGGGYCVWEGFSGYMWVLVGILWVRMGNCEWVFVTHGCVWVYVGILLVFLGNCGWVLVTHGCAWVQVGILCVCID